MKRSGRTVLDLCGEIEAQANILPIYRSDNTVTDSRSLVREARRQARDLTDLEGRAVVVVDSRPEIVLRGFLAVLLAKGVPVILTPQRPGESQKSVTDRLTVVAREVGANMWYGDGAFRRLSADVPETAAPPVDIARGDTAYLQYSSGSVGRPRPLRISHRALIAQLDILAETFGLHGYDVVSSWLPLSHDMGLIGGALLAMHLRLPLLLWTPQEFIAAPVPWIRQMVETNSTYFPIIPVGMHVVTKAITSSGVRPPLRVVPVGADLVRPGIVRSFESAARSAPGVVRPCYGLSDATLMVTCAPAGQSWRTWPLPGAEAHSPVEQLISVGPPVRDTCVWIERNGQRLTEEHTVGDVIVQSISRCSGPYGTSEVVAQEVPVRTGDLGFFADGELVFAGRASEVVRVAGEDYLPADVEEFVIRNGHARPGRVAVVGVDGTAVTRMIAVIENDQANGAERRQLLRVARDHGIPLSDVRYVSAGWLPKTTSGKLQRMRVASELGDV